jgi:hypothetical protein
MAVISTRLHGAGDYATGAGLLAAPNLLGVDDPVAAGILRGTGAAILGLSAVTDYELGLLRRLPVPIHLLIDAATGATLAAAGSLWLRRRGGGLTGRLRRSGGGVANWLPHVVVGVAEIGGAALTARRAGDRAGSGDADLTDDSGKQATPGDPGKPGDAASQSEHVTRLAPAGRPPHTLPGEVPADAEFDPLVAREAAAAAAAARRIGGGQTAPAGDPSMGPVYQAGGGEQDGWEEVEELLVENATHGDGYANPERDAFTPEAESDRSSAVYGEPDALRSTELEDEQVTDVQQTPPGGPDAPPRR